MYFIGCTLPLTHHDTRPPHARARRCCVYTHVHSSVSEEDIQTLRCICDALYERNNDKVSIPFSHLILTGTMQRGEFFLQIYSIFKSGQSSMSRNEEEGFILLHRRRIMFIDFYICLFSLNQHFFSKTKENKMEIMGDPLTMNTTDFTQ